MLLDEVWKVQMPFHNLLFGNKTDILGLGTLVSCQCLHIQALNPALKEDRAGKSTNSVDAFPPARQSQECKKQKYYKTSWG